MLLNKLYNEWKIKSEVVKFFDVNLDKFFKSNFLIIKPSKVIGILTYRTI